MNGIDRAIFERIIREKIADLEQETLLAHDSQAVVLLDQQAVGRLSRMDALQSQAMAKAGQVRRDRHMSALLSALGRLESDDFGYYDTCGKEIARKRMEFDPTAARCITCAG